MAPGLMQDFVHARQEGTRSQSARRAPSVRPPVELEEVERLATSYGKSFGAIDALKTVSHDLEKPSMGSAGGLSVFDTASYRSNSTDGLVFEDQRGSQRRHGSASAPPMGDLTTEDRDIDDADINARTSSWAKHQRSQATSNGAVHSQVAMISGKQKVPLQKVVTTDVATLSQRRVEQDYVGTRKPVESRFARTATPSMSSVEAASQNSEADSRVDAGIAEDISMAGTHSDGEEQCAGCTASRVLQSGTLEQDALFRQQHQREALLQHLQAYRPEQSQALAHTLAEVTNEGKAATRKPRPVPEKMPEGPMIVPEFGPHSKPNERRMSFQIREGSPAAHSVGPGRALSYNNEVQRSNQSGSKRRHDALGGSAYAQTGQDPQPDRSLDHDEAKLFKMKFSQLQREPFDPEPAHDTEDGPSRNQQQGASNLLQQLEMLLNDPYNSTSCRENLAALSLEDWEKAGTWLIERFSAVKEELARSRRARRDVAREYEDEVARRHQLVGQQRKKIDDEVERLRKGKAIMTPRKE